MKFKKSQTPVAVFLSTTALQLVLASAAAAQTFTVTSTGSVIIRDLSNTYGVGTIGNLAGRYSLADGSSNYINVPTLTGFSAANKVNDAGAIIATDGAQSFFASSPTNVSFITGPANTAYSDLYLNNSNATAASAFNVTTGNALIATGNANVINNVKNVGFFPFNVSSIDDNGIVHGTNTTATTTDAAIYNSTTGTITLLPNGGSATQTYVSTTAVSNSGQYSVFNYNDGSFNVFNSSTNNFNALNAAPGFRITAVNDANNAGTLALTLRNLTTNQNVAGFASLENGAYVVQNFNNFVTNSATAFTSAFAVNEKNQFALVDATGQTYVSNATITAQPSAAPEPGTFSLVAIAAGVTGLIKAHRRRAANQRAKTVTVRKIASNDLAA